MFPVFIENDIHGQALMASDCPSELWAWREAKQYFIATDRRRRHWKTLNKAFDALKAAYTRAILSSAMMSAA